MSGSDIHRYIISVSIADENLTDCNELTNHLTLGGFVLSMKDDEGKIRALGSHTFGLLSPLSVEEVTNLVQGLCNAALDKEVTFKISTWDEWLKAHSA